MRNLLLILLVSSLNCLAVQPAQVGDGASMSNAVIIKETRGEVLLKTEEDKWLAEHYPGYTDVKTTAEIIGYDQHYNWRVIVTSSGQEITVYFDVSLFYREQHKKMNRKASHKR
jgi:hypothetical protein